LLALIDGISTDDVARVAQAHFDPDQLTVVSLGPKATD
jgi:predicted Zn-dependent peptidase